MIDATEQIHRLVDEVYQTESRRVFATLIRLLGDFDLAEDALHDAFAAALKQWAKDGVPANPRAWLVSTGRFKAIDGIRRRARFDASLATLAAQIDDNVEDEEEWDDEGVADDRLRLIFTCCHPALSPEARVALTLREVCGLTTEEIARAFLAAPATMAQRLVRAKTKIRDARIPYEVPEASELAERTEAVMAVIYLVFNEGYTASQGDEWVRRDLCSEAIRLARLMVELLAAQPAAAELREARGLLALMLLHDSRGDARTDANGDMVLLEDQDRSKWHRAQIAEALALVPDALRGGAGPYALQAAIAALHAQATTAAETDWPQIAALYAELHRRQPTPIIALNHAVAIAFAEGPAAGLTRMDALATDLADYHLWYAARADLLRRLGRNAESARAYRKALELVGSDPERRFLERRLAEVT
jgi:RNA polymerase sigma-70 factor, ECF subfamily